MARRRVSRKLPLEWVGKYLALGTKATIYTAELDLDLLQDEIAEIWNIDANLGLVISAAAAVDDLSTADAYLSMDPDADKGPDITSTYEDLETFFHQTLTVNTILDGAAASAQRHSAQTRKQWRAVDGKPILVGTNVAMVGEYNTSADVYTGAEWQVRLYFSRRRATASELNQILLKRR